MKRALFLLLAITALLAGCQAPAENRTAAEAAASSAHIDAEEKQAAWDTYYDRLCEKSLLEHAMDATTIVYGTVSEIKPSYQYKWQVGGDVSGTVAFTPAVIDVDTYYAFSDRYVPSGTETYLVAGGKTDNRKGFQELAVQLETGDEVFAFIGKTSRLQNESAIFPVTGGKIKVHTDMLPTFYEMEEEGWVELPLDQFENIIIDLLDMYGNN